MATTLLRAFVLMITLTGFSASVYTGGTTTSGRGSVSANNVDGGTGSPISTCLPSDPNHCGMD